MIDVLSSLFKSLFLAYAACFFLLPIVSVYQERRIWKHPLPRLSLWGCAKVYWYNVYWLTLSQLGVLGLLPFFLLGVNVEIAASLVERYTAYIIAYIFVGPVVIRGNENLPPPTQSVVYIANHSSQIDACVVYFLRRRFKGIAKKEIVYMPGAGLLALMARHVFINRKKGSNKESIQKMYAETAKALTSGKSIWIFPQGTREMIQQLPFKDGAFNIAMESQVPIVPISIQIPRRAWNQLYPFNLLWNRNIEPAILTIHKAIPVTKDSNKEALKEECFRVVYSVLPLAAASKKTK